MAVEQHHLVSTGGFVVGKVTVHHKRIILLSNPNKGVHYTKNTNGVGMTQFHPWILSFMWVCG